MGVKPQIINPAFTSSSKAWKRYPCTYDIYLEIDTGRLWRLEQEKGKGGAILTRFFDIKTGDVRSPGVLEIDEYNPRTNTVSEPYKFIGNFPTYDIETLEILYGQRKSPWNY